MSETKKIIKGQAWISGDMLVQDQITFETDGTVTSCEKVLINNIWDDSLLCEASKTAPAETASDVDTPKYKFSVLSSVSVKKEDGTTEQKITKCYFYWEYTMTDSEDDSREVVVRLECPKPVQGLFGPCSPYKEDYPGDYAKFYVNKLKEAEENYENCAAIQKREIIFPGTQRMDFSDGTIKQEEEFRVNNTDIGDITNLLSLF